MTLLTADERAALVAAAGDIISRGSQSFRAASRLFDAPTRERAWLLYAWCRAADDLTDGQDLGHGATAPLDPAEAQAKLAALTSAALDSDQPVPPPFLALRQVARETTMPRGFIADHLAGFALDSADWRPQTEDDLLRYCYHVAGTVGCMMAVVMGVDPADQDTLDRACDLGIAFQLANIARDLVPDALVWRCYIPAVWLEEFGLTETSLALRTNRPALAQIAARMVKLARPYRASARIGASLLPRRSRQAVLAADAIYGAIGEKVLKRGEAAWDQRVRVNKAGKLALFTGAMLRASSSPPNTLRTELWSRPRQAIK
jgi:15-cis-phytoene synthase